MKNIIYNLYSRVFGVYSRIDKNTKKKIYGTYSKPNLFRKTKINVKGNNNSLMFGYSIRIKHTRYIYKWE